MQVLLIAPTHFFKNNQMKKAYSEPTSITLRLETENNILNNSIEVSYNNEYSDQDQLSNQKTDNWSSDSWSNDEGE